MGVYSPPPVPRAYSQSSFDLIHDIHIHLSAFLCEYLVDVLRGKTLCICSKDVTFCKQDLPRRERGDIGAIGLYQCNPKMNAADPKKSPGGLLLTGVYPLEEEESLRAREKALIQVESSTKSIHWNWVGGKRIFTFEAAN